MRQNITLHVERPRDVAATVTVATSCPTFVVEVIDEHGSGAGTRTRSSD